MVSREVNQCIEGGREAGREGGREEGREGAGREREEGGREEGRERRGEKRRERKEGYFVLCCYAHRQRRRCRGRL